MNESLEKVLTTVQEMDSLLYAYEAAYLGAEALPGQEKKASRAECAFYAIWNSCLDAKERLENIVEYSNSSTTEKECERLKLENEALRKAVTEALKNVQ